MDPASVYAVVGGQPWFDELVDRFYDGVDGDALLRPLYPADLTDSKQHLARFLAQYWGGPTTYSDERGHPRLRMRHMPFEIRKAERDAWCAHMTAAVRSGGLSEEVEQAMLDYFDNAATHLVNAVG